MLMMSRSIHTDGFDACYDSIIVIDQAENSLAIHFDISCLFEFLIRAIGLGVINDEKLSHKSVFVRSQLTSPSYVFQSAISMSIANRNLICFSLIWLDALWSALIIPIEKLMFHRI